MTDPIPPLVDVIAEAQMAHSPLSAMESHKSNTVTSYCACGAQIAEDSPLAWPAPNHAAHQARAVLAALAGAGCVEWGVRWGYISEMFPERTDWAQSPEVAQAIIDKSFASGSVVTRIAAGPWAAVEG